MATNDTTEDFILLGFSKEQRLISLLLAMVYIMIVFGNMTVFSIIQVDRHLHTPMYFFLSCLSILDICYPTVSHPAMLVNAITGNRRISFNGCFTQFYFLAAIAGTQTLILAAMAYDRYVAICDPLHYPLIMNKMFCWCFVVGCWVFGLLNSVFHTMMILKLTFCGDRHIHHYFCEVLPMLKAACSNTDSTQVVLHVIAVFLGVAPFLIVIISYIRIISTILKIHSSEGRQKVFSTCSSHLIVVTMFYITTMLNYNGPISGDSFVIVRVSSIVYSILPPLFNPVIYCLRNQEVKGALKKALHFHRQSATPRAN